jgi:TRAP transporter 4TM/12TM fusion protein
LEIKAMSNKSVKSVGKTMFGFAALLILAYHMISTVVLFQGPMEHQIVHLGMVFFLVFMNIILSDKKTILRLGAGVLLIAGLIAVVYMRWNYDYLVDVVGFPENDDIAIGIVLLVVVIIGTWTAWGSVFPILAIILLIYYFWGHHLPGPLYHPPIDLDLGISNLSVGFTGMFGSLLSVMANFGMNLVMFGAFLELAGANRFFQEVGKAAGRKLAGGPGHTAVIGSSLVGMVSGGAIGNVLITGSFTIPMMKRVGYRSETAGAIEATASTGSQLMPPIMGIAAFLMAGFLSIDFSVIMKAGVIPSLLFYLAVAFGVQFIAKKEGIKAEAVDVDRGIIVSQGPLFIVPLGLLIVLLLNNFSAGISSFVVNILLLVMVYLRKSTRPSWKALLEAVSKGMVTGARISLAVATVGVLSQVFVNTGLAQKLSVVVGMISFGIVPLVLFFTMILSLILGLGLPAAAAYSLVAILIAPGLVQMGFEPIRVHFFAFYFAIISAVTPPVALGALAASTIAESGFMKTGLEAFKLSLPNFIMPFLIIYNPVFLLLPETTLVAGVISIVTAAAGMVLLTASIYKYLRSHLMNWERLLLFLSSISLFTYCATVQVIWLVPGIVAGGATVAWHFKRTAVSQPAAA